ncbi:MAG: hypothetical protein CMG04_08540 [Candidatus Marinimicrobia bacterium]|nr:hypothetical protein [Candidatus Neomarinimicrobiota bacterium]
MFKNIIITSFIVLLYAGMARGQDNSIFFLKDGSIVQGTIVNENKTRIFLKTDQGTIKILTMNILGREDLAKQGDLSFMSDRVDHLQNHVDNLTGRLEVWNDSLQHELFTTVKTLNELESLQAEFEVDLLRVHSQTRDQKKKLKYLQDEMVDKRIDIASNRQNLGGLKDTVNFYVKQFKKANQTLENTTNTAFILTGTVSNTRKDLQDVVLEQQKQINRIDIMSGSLAHLIQEIQIVTDSFEGIKFDIEKNAGSIERIKNEMFEKNQLTNIRINKIEIDSEKQFKLLEDTFEEKIDLLNRSLDEHEDQNMRERKKIELDISDMEDLLQRQNEKVIKKVDELEKEFYTVKVSIDESLSLLKNNIDRLDNDMRIVKKAIEKKK